MRRGQRRLLWVLAVGSLLSMAAWLTHLYYTVQGPLPVRMSEPLHVVVADPLCRRLADPCMAEYAERDYGLLNDFLAERVDRPVEIVYAEPSDEGLRVDWTHADLIIGRPSTVLPQARKAGQSVRPILHLTDGDGRREFFGTFLVRRQDPAGALSDIKDHLILFGPPEQEARHAAALRELGEYGVAVVPPLEIVPDAREAARKVVTGEADVTVVPSFAASLLDGLGGPGEQPLRVIGQTEAIPVATVYATQGVSPAAEERIVSALLATAEDSALLATLDSRGFVRPDEASVEAEPEPARPAPRGAAWTDWRGPGRMGISPDVPARLPQRVRLLWKRGLTGPGLSGVVATDERVIVADKSEQNDQDIWRCLDAETGEELWTIAYATPGQMEFTNAPRATPVIHGGFVYLLGAFGDLYCVAMHSHRIIWRRNLVEDFDADLPAWGLCSTPLVVGDSLIINPGAEEASLVALGLYTGDVLWTTPGAPAAPASLILGTFGGVRQIVGYDADSLGGWDPNTGERLWTLVPPVEGDYNVATPVAIEGRLLVATDNNGTRLYDFDTNGRIQPTPVAQNLELRPEMSTPVVLDGLVFGCASGLHCLDLTDNLRTRYSAESETTFKDYASLIAGNDHILATTVAGELVLLMASRNHFTPVSRLTVFEDTELWSHPALVGNRLYVRSMKEIACLLLDGP